MADVVQAEITRAQLKPRADEIFRGLWASLFYSGRAAGKSVVVCSADRQEGATTTACGLAIAGSTPAGSANVALVDFNLRNPAVHRLLRANPSPGVAEVVCDGLPRAEAAQKVNTGLDVFAAGAGAGRILDMLRAEHAQRFFTDLAGAYDYVIADAPPANHFPEAQVLAGLLRDVLLVAHTERTPREAVAQAKKRLEAGGGKVAGVVLNLRTYPIPKFLYRRV